MAISYSGADTLTSMNSNFKYVQEKLMSLMPENAMLLKLVPEITTATEEGRSYLQSVQLSFENGRNAA